MNVSQVLDRVNRAIEEPVSELEIYKAMVLLHNKLSEPKWAIEDEKLRGEMEKLLIQMVVEDYMQTRKGIINE